MRVALIAPSLAVTDASSHNADHLFRLCGGNTGNFAFVFALHQLLSHHETTIEGWTVDPARIKDRYDLIVFACANQLGPHTDLGWLADRLDAMDRPILAIGLGAQAADTSRPVELTPGTRRWLDVIAAHAPASYPNIAVRGPYTQSQLQHFGHAARGTVIGCPSNYINPDPVLGETIVRWRAEHGITRIAVPAGLHLWPALKAIEQHLVSLVEDCGGLYVAQSEIDMIRLARDEAGAVAPDVLESIRAYIHPDLNTADFVRWMRRYATTFIDAPSWSDAMRKFDFVVGPRFHGVMLAIQAGVPGGVIAHDSRTLELCQTLAIPVRHHKDVPADFKLDDLPKLFAFDGDLYDQKRAALGEILATMLRQAGLTPFLPFMDDMKKERAAA